MQLNTLSMVHDFIRQNVGPGARCIDATAGKGRDTLLLCRLAGESGQVTALDIQPEAVAMTQALLESAGVHAEVVQDDHRFIARYAAPESVDCIVFNFGRLPGGDVNIMTRADSSVAAIEAGLPLLRIGGVMAIALYYGGANGTDECDAVLQFLRSVDERRYSVLICDWANRKNCPPMPIFIWRER